MKLSRIAVVIVVLKAVRKRVRLISGFITPQGYEQINDPHSFPHRFRYRDNY